MKKLSIFLIAALTFLAGWFSTAPASASGQLGFTVDCSGASGLGEVPAHTTYTWFVRLYDSGKESGTGLVIDKTWQGTVDGGDSGTAFAPDVTWPFTPSQGTSTDDSYYWVDVWNFGNGEHVFHAEGHFTCEPPPQAQPGTGTPGYWMNHPEAWPVDEITIGGVTYSKAEAIEYMKMPVKGDKTLTMFPALVSAKLNVLIGNDASCIADTISAADAWMAAYGPVGSGVKGSSQAWKDGEPLYLRLDDYNNGRLCAPHRD